MERKSNYIVILGAGESGIGAAMLAQKQGFEVFVSDKGQIGQIYKEQLERLEIPFEEGTHTAEKILSATEIIKSPGIPEKAPLIQELRRTKIPVISEIEFAKRYTSAKMICITGSNGKSTTTLLTYHILKEAGLNVGLAGNIGHSFAAQVAEQNFDYYVLEISSFMLDDMYDFKADIAVLLNITPDHLDRYEYQMEKYAASKMKITQNQTEEDLFIYCADDEETQKILAKTLVKSKPFTFSRNPNSMKNNAYLNEKTQTIHVNLEEESPLEIPMNEISITGKHNAYNAMASAAVAKSLHIRNPAIRESMRTFKNLAHRLEFAGTVSGIHFINDSKATNINSTWFALESMSTPTILILGGIDKGNDYQMLMPLVKQKVKAIICLGVDNKVIHESFDHEVPFVLDAKSAQEAVEMAFHLGTKGDTVLLSPACASFDLFENYQDRGNQFKEAIKNL